MAVTAVGGSLDAAPWSLPHVLATIGLVFDAALYAREYRDIKGTPAELLAHFCEHGWKEGRNPHSDFDTLAYLRAYPDVLQHGANPIYHYLHLGREEGRLASPATLPSRAAMMILRADPGDWVALLTPHVDKPFYAAALGEAADDSFDLVAHYAYRGWLDGLDPNPGFNTREALRTTPDLLRKQLNPLVHALAVAKPPAPPAPPPVVVRAVVPQAAQATPDVSVEMPRFGPGASVEAFTQAAALRQALDDAVPTPVERADPDEATIAGDFDVVFYRVMNPDVVAAGMDLVTHYNRHGWREGRNPAPWFDDQFYLATNPDVAASGGNPFLHYLTAGRAEGRRPSAQADWRRAVLDRATEPTASPVSSAPLPQPSLLTLPALEEALRAACAAGKGLAVSISHGSLPALRGGIALWLGDEQAGFAAKGVTYLNASPVRPISRLALPDGTALRLRLELNGQSLGVAEGADLERALRAVAPEAGERIFIIHGIAGHGIGQLIDLQAALGSTQNLFWVHDYSAVCPGINLLRNDVAFCGAPPVDSVACRVCVYGGLRPDHVEGIRRLFGSIPFQVMAPSQAALDVWQRGPVQAATTPRVHGPSHLVPGDQMAVAAVADPSLRGAPGDPVRVAFVGSPTSQKGWPIWSDLVKRIAGLGAYRFIHLGSPDTVPPVPGLEHIEVTTTAADRAALVRTVAERGIDLVLVLSIWPETFSMASLEAIAGGADIVCLRDSGSIAEAVRQHGRGVVVADEAALSTFFESLAAVAYVRRCRATPAPSLRLIHDGISAMVAQFGSVAA